MNLLLLHQMGLGMSKPQRRLRARREERRGYSAATTTTATTRDAAQIDCAALGEHGLKAGGHG
jgi:hypothetical protein